MPTDPAPLTLADLVRRAAALVDPHGADAAVAGFTSRYDDDDAPVRGMLGSLGERVRWGAHDEPTVMMAQALVLYLAHRPEEVDANREELLVRAARAEFSGDPPAPVVDWLSSAGVTLR